MISYQKLEKIIEHYGLVTENRTNRHGSRLIGVEFNEYVWTWFEFDYILNEKIERVETGFLTVFEKYSQRTGVSKKGYSIKWKTEDRVEKLFGKIVAKERKQADADYQPTKFEGVSDTLLKSIVENADQDIASEQAKADNGCSVGEHMVKFHTDRAERARREMAIREIAVKRVDDLNSGDVIVNYDGTKSNVVTAWIEGDDDGDYIAASIKGDDNMNRIIRFRDKKTVIVSTKLTDILRPGIHVIRKEYLNGRLIDVCGMEFIKFHDNGLVLEFEKNGGMFNEHTFKVHIDRKCFPRHEWKTGENELMFSEIIF